MPKYQPITTDVESKMLKYINELGCIRYDQFQYLLPNISPTVIQHDIQYMYDMFRIDIKESNIIVPRKDSLVDHDVIDCLWIVIDNLVNINTELLYKAQAPSSILYQLNDGIIQELVKITFENAKQIPLLEQRYYDRLPEDDKGTFQYVYVIDDDRLLDTIAGYNPKTPHIIAKYSLIPNALPRIDYYKPDVF